MKILRLKKPVNKGQRLNSIYVISTETTYIDRTRKNEIADLWHVRLTHVSYSILKCHDGKVNVEGYSKTPTKERCFMC